MRVSTAAILGLCLISLLVPLTRAESPPSSSKTTSDSGHVVTAPAPAVEDTSMLTGNGINTKSWPIDRPAQDGVLRKLPGSREWVFVRGLTDAQMRQLGKKREEELLRLHGHEPRDVEIVVPDSSALRKLPRHGIASSCAPPCTLSARVLYRQLPQLTGDSLVFWGKGDRKPATPGTRQRPLPPGSERTPPPTTKPKGGS